MSSNIKPFSLISGVLLCSGVIYSLQGCHKEPPIGRENATVASGQNNNSSQPTATATTPVATPMPMASPEVTVAARPPSPKEKQVPVAKKGQQVFAMRLPGIVPPRPLVEVIKGSKAAGVDFIDQRVELSAELGGRVKTSNTASDFSDTGPTSSREPSVLIEKASELLQGAKVSDYGNIVAAEIVAVKSILRAREIRVALEYAQRAIALIKQQPEPSDAESKAHYLSTKRAALEVRAEALNWLASRIDPREAVAAERAYREYLATESDTVKVARAENDLAAIFFTTKQFEKAKIAYQRILARDPRNESLLERLTEIMRSIAKQQEAAGQFAEAKKSSEAAAVYSKQMQEIENARTIPASNPAAGGRNDAKVQRVMPPDNRARKAGVMGESKSPPKPKG